MDNFLIQNVGISFSLSAVTGFNAPSLCGVIITSNWQHYWQVRWTSLQLEQHTRPACRAAAAAVDQSLLPAPSLSSKPASRHCCCRSTGQTDGRTVVSFMTLTAYCADRVIRSLIFILCYISDAGYTCVFFKFTHNVQLAVCCYLIIMIL